jgi:hypothetical protein
VVLVNVADRDEVDAGRAPVELVNDLEVYPDLLDLGGAVQLVVGTEAGASVLEFDLRIENDVGRDQVGRQQNQTAGSRFAIGRWQPGSAASRTPSRHRLQC